MFVISSGYFKKINFSSSSSKGASIADYCTMRLETGRHPTTSHILLLMTLPMVGWIGWEIFMDPFLLLLGTNSLAVLPLGEFNADDLPFGSVHLQFWLQAPPHDRGGNVGVLNVVKAGCSPEGCHL